jgi:hypothetical protein
MMVEKGGRIEDMKLMILEETHSQPKESDQ